MIPRLTAPRLHRDDPSPFSGLRDDGRPLCFFLDVEGIRESEARSLLLAYAAAGVIDTFALEAIDGARLLELPAVPADYAPTRPLDDVLEAAWVGQEQRGWFALLGISSQLRDAAERASSLGISIAVAERHVLLGAAAVQWEGADGLVTDSAALRELAPAQNLHCTEEAVALVGLWSRLRGDGRVRTTAQLKNTRARGPASAPARAKGRHVEAVETVAAAVLFPAVLAEPAV